MASSRGPRLTLLAALSLVLAGCAVVAGLGDYGPGGGGGGGKGGTAATGGGTATGAGAGGGGGASGVVAAASYGSELTDTMRGLAIDGAGNVYVSGTHAGTLGLEVAHAPTSELGLFVTGLDSSLEPLWSQSFEATANGVLHDLAVSSPGRLALIGQVDASTDLGDGALVPAGTGALLGVFIQGGTLLSSGLFGTSASGLREGKAVISRDGVSYVGIAYEVDPELPPNAPPAPPLQGQTDSVIAAIDDQGTVLWASTITGQGWQTVEAMALDESNRLVVVGTTNATANLDGMTVDPVGTDGKPDVFVARYSTGGQILAVSLFGGEGRTDVADVTVIGDRVIVVGYFDEQLSLAGQLVDAEGDEDGYVVSLFEDLTLDWAHHLAGAGRQRVLSVSGHSSGLVAAAGEFVNAITLDRAYEEPDATALAFVLDEAGAVTWSRAWGGDSLDRAREVVMDKADELVVAGEFSSEISFGDTVLSSVGDRDIFVARVSIAE